MARGSEHPAQDDRPDGRRDALNEAPLSFFDAQPEALEQWCLERAMPRHTAQQLLDWVYRRGVIDPFAMSNIARRHREIIAQEVRFTTGAVRAHQIATDGTEKLLIAWERVHPRFPNEEPLTGSLRSPPLPRAAGERQGEGSASLPLLSPDSSRETESVMIPNAARRTACVSSQIGCPVGCRFCASGIGGVDGNLTAGQIVEQVHHLGDPSGVARITHVVFMGMGEPLANLPAVTAAIRTLNAKWGFGISARRITISTVGLPAAIHKLCEFELPVTLALSLHAPNDELRRTLIPWAEYATIDELLEACDGWFERTGREITFEYLLLGNVNDRPEHARELATLARRLRANVNLIRYNEVRGLPFDRPRTEGVREFQRILRERGVNAHIRASRGRDIAAACGQLRHEARVHRPQ